MKDLKTRLVQTDWNKWLHNTVKFLAPAVLVYLLVVQRTGDLHQANIALYTWALSTGIDLTTKFIAAGK